MANKRDSGPEQTLAIVIAALREHRAGADGVAIAFLLEGEPPVLASAFAAAAIALTPDERAAVADSLRAVLRQLVLRPTEVARIASTTPLDWAVVRDARSRAVVGVLPPRDHGTITADAVRDVARLNLLLLAREVGLQHVRACDAPDCGNLFVKVHRRTYCSTRCQQRHFKQVRRENARMVKERRRRLYLAQKRKGV